MSAKEERRAEEIEVTPEMIEAGVLKLPPLLSEYDDMEDAIVRIFRAMEMVACKPLG